MKREFSFEIDVSDLAHPNAANRMSFTRDVRDKVLVEPLGRNDDPLCLPIIVPVPPNRPSEIFEADGTMRVVSGPMPLTVTFKLAREPKSVRLRVGWRSKVVPFEARKRAKFPSPVFENVYAGPVDLWRLIIVSDRFAESDRERFFTLCGLFADYVKQTAPFSRIGRDGGDPGAGDGEPHFVVDACFVPARGESLFDTECDTATRRMYGKPKLVLDFLEKHEISRRSNDMVLVLANFSARGGAGEFGNENIAWVTPVSEDSETWFDIALHEIGHAFELDDEYETPWPEAPPGDYRNVTRDPDPAKAPWAGLYKAWEGEPVEYPFERRGLADNEERNYSLEAEQLEFGDKLGMFEGARYFTRNVWRSSLECKMRLTNMAFCRCCQEIILQGVRENS